MFRSPQKMKFFAVTSQFISLPLPFTSLLPLVYRGNFTSELPLFSFFFYPPTDRIFLPLPLDLPLDSSIYLSITSRILEVILPLNYLYLFLFLPSYQLRHGDLARGNVKISYILEVTILEVITSNIVKLYK